MSESIKRQHADIRSPAPDAKRRRVITQYAPYSFSRGFRRQPCEKPHENDKNIQLNFNYWQREHAILPSEVSNIILHVLNSGSPRPLPLPEFMHPPTTPITKLVIVAAHGISPLDIGRDMPNSPFLSSCSSVPIRYCHVQPLKDRWRYDDIEPMASLILWRNKSGVPLKEIATLGVLPFFNSYRLSFLQSVQNSLDEKGEFLFRADNSVRQKIVDLLSDEPSQMKFKEFVNLLIGEDADPAYKEQVISQLTQIEDSVFGRLKRVHHDYGTFVVKKVQEFTLLLLLHSQGISDLLLLTSDHTQHTSGVVEFKNSRCALHLLAAVAVDPKTAPAEVDSQTSTGMEAWMQNSSRRILDQYRDFLQCENALSILEHSVLSMTLLDCLGFPVQTTKVDDCDLLLNVSVRDRPFFMATHSASWQSGACSEEREREEGECSDEESQDGSPAAELISPHVLAALGSCRLAICALDCEMCTTSLGLELTRISIISPEIPTLIVLDTLVRPENPITDYHTEFSGITAEALQGVTVSLSQIRVELMRLIGPETIVVGHSLDSDMRSLKLVHHRVIDTAALFPHIKGAPFKSSLKTLALEVLALRVQEDEAGHNSIQDAAVALELAFTYLNAQTSGPDGASVSHPPWSSSDHFLHPKVPLLEDVCPSADGCAKVRAYVCGPHAAKPEYERFLLGYRRESCVASTLRCTGPGLVDAASIACRPLDVPVSADDSRAVIWADYDATDTALGSLGLGAFAERLWQSASAGTLLLVATQSDLLPLCAKLSKKRKSAWDKDGSFEWLSDVDERELNIAAALSMSGSLFLRMKEA